MTDAKAEVARIFKASGLTRSELAHLLRGNPGSVHWMLESNSAPQIDTLAMFAHAMGYEIQISFRRRK